METAVISTLFENGGGEEKCKEILMDWGGFPFPKNSGMSCTLTRMKI